MKNIFPLFLSLLSLFVISSCNNKNKDDKETILTGTATIYVDETVRPIIEDNVAVFEGEYDAKIIIISKSETEVVNSLLNNEANIVVLSRPLTEEEFKYFVDNKINPKITKFAIDAVALIGNRKDKDTLVNLDDIISIAKGNKLTNIKGLVFDNPNSSTVRYIKELAGIDKLPENKVFSFETNEEAIKFISENMGMVGVVGVNWLLQPTKAIEKYQEKIRILRVKESKGKEYYSPSQDEIASLQYPLRRDLYIINCQGFSGLGMGFASFIAGYTGQRIILKSGLVPVEVPTRAIHVVK